MSSVTVSGNTGRRVNLIAAVTLLLVAVIVATLFVGSIAQVMPRGMRLALAYVFGVVGLCLALYGRSSAWWRTEDPAAAAAGLVSGVLAALASAFLLRSAYSFEGVLGSLFDFVVSAARDTPILRRLMTWLWFVFFIADAIILLLYLLLRWLVVFFARMFFTHLRDRKDYRIEFFTNNALHAGSIILLVIVVAAVLLGAFWVVEAPATTIWRIPEEIAYFPWVAIVILTAELAGAFRPSGEFSARGEARPAVQVHAEVPSVEPLYKLLTESGSGVAMWAEPPIPVDAGDAATLKTSADDAVDAMQSERAQTIIRHLRRPAGPAQPPVIADERVPEAAEAIAGFIGGDKGSQQILLLPETLASVQFRLLAELVLDTLDEGGVALCVCPDTQTVQCQQRFYEAFASAGVELLVDMLVPRVGAKAEEALHHVIIVELSEFDRYLLTDATRRNKEVRRLSLVMVLDLHLMDMARLSLSLRRLWQSVPFELARFVIGCTGIENIEVFIENHLQAGTERRIRRLSLLSGKASQAYRIAVEPNAATAELLVPLLANEAGLAAGGLTDVTALLALVAITQGFRPVIHDPLSRWQFRATDDGTGEPWSSEIENAPLLSRLRPQVAASFKAIEVVQYLPDRHRDCTYGRVVIVEAGDNWMSNAKRPYGFPDPYDTLVIVVIRRAELLPYIYHGADQRGPTSALGPPRVLAPSPGVGPAELAYIMQDRLNSPGGLRLSAFEDLFETFAKSDLLMEGAQIGTDQTGIKRAFEWSPSAPKVEVRVEREESGEPVFKVSARIALPAMREARKDGRPFADLVASDLGLLYAPGTMLRIGHSYHTVSSVNADGSIVVTAVVPAKASRTRRPSPRIAVEYRLDFANKFVVANAPPAKDNSASQYGRHLEMSTVLVGQAERRTLGFYEEYENEPPFDEAGRPTQSDQTVAVSWHELMRPWEPRSVRVLHLTYARSIADSAQPGGGKSDSVANYAARQSHTLCVLWKELIQTSFPRHASRVTVVSPQVEPLHATMEKASGPGGASDGSRPLTARAQYALRRYGRVKTVDDPLNSRIGVLASHREFLARPTTRRIDIYIIEDADWDLGIVRAIVEQNDLFRHLRTCVDLYAGDRPDDKPIRSHGFLGFGGRDRDPTFVLGQVKWVLGMETAFAEPTAEDDRKDTPLAAASPDRRKPASGKPR